METQMYIPQKSDASLIVLENDQIRVFPLDTKPEWNVGRYDSASAKAPDILFASMIVSRKHGWIKKIDNQWFYIDNPKNLNGTFRNGEKYRGDKTM